MNNYTDLLEHLIACENYTTTIEINVSLSGLRKGLQKAVSDYNESVILLGGEPLPSSVSIVEDANAKASGSDAAVVTIALTTEPKTGARFKPKFQFKLVDPKGDTGNDTRERNDEEQ